MRQCKRSLSFFVLFLVYFISSLLCSYLSTIQFPPCYPLIFPSEHSVNALSYLTAIIIAVGDPAITSSTADTSFLCVFTGNAAQNTAQPTAVASQADDATSQAATKASFLNSPIFDHYPLKLSFDPSCSEGDIFYICDFDTSFLGCCDIDNYSDHAPCEDACSNSTLESASFDPDKYGDIKDQDCSGGGDWYTCEVTNPPFMGCCLSDPCDFGCPSDDLKPGFLSSHYGNH